MVTLKTKSKVILNGIYNQAEKLNHQYFYNALHHISNWDVFQNVYALVAKLQKISTYDLVLNEQLQVSELQNVKMINHPTHKYLEDACGEEVLPYTIINLLNAYQYQSAKSILE